MKEPVIRELRAVQRFTVSLPVIINWRSGGRPVRGFTRDISTRGMFVLADVGPGQGELVEFEIDLAMDELTPLVLVEGQGRVVRVESPAPEGQPLGLAVHNVWFKLRAPEEGEALPAQVQALAGRVARPAAGVRKPDRRRRLSIVPPAGQTD